MFVLKIKSQFSAAHFLNNYEGKCENVHGHNWYVELGVKGIKLDDIGLLIDFKDLKKKLEAVLNTLDHRSLNEIECFKNTNPSCEYIAKYIYDESVTLINTDKVKVSSVQVWETEGCSATYEE